MTTAAEIKRTFEQYEIARLECQRMIWSECTEAEFDAACDAEIEAQETFTQALVEFAGGQLTEEDVFWMLARQHDRVAELICRLAA
jgi:hypothetical protein